MPWKTVAAGGAAAGTIIAAYKVSDGVEEGIKTVAKEKPEVFADTLSVLTWPIRLAALALFLLVFKCLFLLSMQIILSLHFVAFFIKRTCILLKDEYIIYTALYMVSILPHKAEISLLLDLEKPDMVEVDATYLWHTQYRVDAGVVCVSTSGPLSPEHDSATFFRTV